MIEYRVRRVTRFIITRYEDNSGALTGAVCSGSVEALGIFENEDQALRVAAGLTASEADKGAIFCRNLGE